VSACVRAQAGTVDWQGNALKEVRTLGGLPPALQKALGVGGTGMAGIADRGGKFNSSDVIGDAMPTRRFLVAGLGRDGALVAVERGGFALYTNVTWFSDVERRPVARQTWTIAERPETLRALVERLRVH
jgi:hypothetical protein